RIAARSTRERIEVPVGGSRTSVVGRSVIPFSLTRPSLLEQGRNVMLPREPADAFADELTGHTRPVVWRNPKPAGRYNLVVLGAGPAGLICAAGAAALGAKVALVEKYRLGGDCLHFGCVPSKALLRCGRAAAESRRASEFGIRTAGAPAADFGAVMERVRRLRARLSHADSTIRFTSLGVDLFFGTAGFSGPDAIMVEGTTLRFASAVIATGASAVGPSLPSLNKEDYLTNETIFNL